MMDDVISRLREFMDNEARSCSMDFGCITPLYVYRMWGGQVPLKDVEEAYTHIAKWRLILDKCHLLQNKSQLLPRCHEEELKP